MPFLIRNDFHTSIEDSDLDIFTSTDDNVLNEAIETSKIMLQSYISDRYDVAIMFPDVLLYDFVNTFQIGNKVVLLANDFEFGRAYVVGDMVTDPATQNVYRSILNGTSQPLSNATYWTLLGVNRKVYTCTAVATGKRPNETDYFSVGEARNSLLIRLMVDLVLYDIHSILSARNIPEHRIQRRDDAIKYLKDVANPRSNVNPNFPLVDHGTDRGVDISFGTTTNLNAY